MSRSSRNWEDPTPPIEGPAASRGAPGESSRVVGPEARRRDLEAELRDTAVRYFQGRMKPFRQSEVEDLLEVDRTTIWRYRRDGILKCFVRGRVVRFHVEDVYRLLMSQTV